MTSSAWSDIKLGELVNIQRKNINPQNHPELQFEHYSLPAFDNNKQPERSLGENIKSSKYILPYEGVLFSKLNLRFKRVWKINNKKSIDTKICSSEFFPVVVKESQKLDLDFLYYTLISDNFICDLEKTASGTSGSHQRISVECFLNKEIVLPNIEVQKAISKILSTIDEKIEINNKISKKLENVAQAIFKQWLIDFEFPNEDDEPYKTSGGEMIECEIGAIPSGWSVKSLYELAEYINGTSFKKDEMSENKGLPIIKIAELKEGITNSTKYCISVKQEKYYLKNGDVLFSWSGNPDTSIDTFIWYRGDGILNQHIFKVTSTVYANEFIYLVLKHFKPMFIQIASNKQTTGLGHVTVGDLKRLKIALPDMGLMDDFSSKIKPIVEKIHTIDLENNKLSELRDNLIPKLLSGEIIV